MQLMRLSISIQALYDYKSCKAFAFTYMSIFQFKHCTIIREYEATISYRKVYFNSSIVRL